MKKALQSNLKKQAEQSRPEQGLANIAKRLGVVREYIREHVHLDARFSCPNFVEKETLNSALKIEQRGLGRRPQLKTRQFAVLLRCARRVLTREEGLAALLLYCGEYNGYLYLLRKFWASPLCSVIVH